MAVHSEKNDRIEKEAKRILALMNLSQKVAQLQCRMVVGDPKKALSGAENGLGEATIFGGVDSPEDNASMSDSVQDTVISKDPNGIPVLLHCEAITGVNAAGATVFPSAIALGATWDPDAVEKMADMIRGQMLAIGVRQALSPVMDVCRDPRWGRIGETYGEDPTLCAAMSVAFTKGLQGEDLKDGVVVTGKHFLGYGLSSGGLNMTSNPIPARELREVYAKPFQAAISEAGLESIMNSYGTIDGEMVIISKHHLNDLLRDEMGFEGIVVSDYMSINRAVSHDLCKDPVEGGIKALQAGLDIELPMPYGYDDALIEAVKRGDISEKLVDRAVLRVLKTKIKLGLFDEPHSRKDKINEIYHSKEAYEHSLETAKRSVVLLKNDGLLPLSKDIKKIAVIGPHADSIRLLFGGYTYPAGVDMGISGAMGEMAGMTDSLGGLSEKPQQMPFYKDSKIRMQNPAVERTLRIMYADTTPTILDSIKEKCPKAHIVYEKGCEIAGTDKKNFAAAIEAAKEADVVILILGGKYGWGNNCTIGEGIDSDRIGLTGVQEDLAKHIWETGTPSVLVHMDARPLSSEFIVDKFPAILENWFPGITGGKAIADVLFGDHDPSGKLPVTVARSPGQIPIYSMQRKGDGYSRLKGMVLNKYAEGDKTPLFYFGHGLSYTKFEYSNLNISESVDDDGVIELSVDIMNTGKRYGEEVVQIYVRDDLSSMLRPDKELAGFRRIALEKGEKKTITFTIKASQFAFLDKDMNWIVEEGMMSVFVGSSSEDIRLKGSFRINNTFEIDGKNRGFFAKTKIN